MIRRQRRSHPRAPLTVSRWGAIAALTTAVFLGTLTAQTHLSAPVAFAAPAALTAPAGTTQVWVDIEGQGAIAAVTEVSAATSGGAWVDAAPTTTPFGRTAIFATAPGPLDLRLRIAEPTTADVAVTFVDAGGTVLAEHLLRSVALSPAHAGTGGWIAWSSLTEGSGAPDNQTPAEGADAQAQGALSRTGQATGLALAPLVFGALAVGVALMLTGAALRSRQTGAAR